MRASILRCKRWWEPARRDDIVSEPRIASTQFKQSKQRRWQTRPEMPLLSAAHIGLLVLVAATPVFLFFDNLVFAGAIQLYVAVTMMILAIGIRPGEARHLFKLVRVPAALAAVPLLWMLIQLLPLKIGGLSQSIWQSATSALETPPLWTSISVDPGLTLIAFSRFASMAGIAFVAAAVSIDRRQVERLLLLLAGAAAVISLILLASQLGGFGSKNESGANGTHATMVTAGIIGIILFAASAIMVVERYEMGRQPRPSSSRRLVPIGIMVAGLLVCSLTLIAGDSRHAIFAAACGLTTVAIIYFVRRLGFGSGAGLAMGCVAILAVAVIIWTKGRPATGDVSLRYMTGANSDVVALDNRILDTVGLAGSGAGTFPVISTIYGAQEPGDARAATFAGQIAIELGHPALWVIVGFACTLIVMFARSAFNRGRDCFYPLAGAGVTAAMILDCFTNATLTNLAISVLVAVTLGLGFGQSIGRSLGATP